VTRVQAEAFPLQVLPDIHPTYPGEGSVFSILTWATAARRTEEAKPVQPETGRRKRQYKKKHVEGICLTGTHDRPHRKSQ
jgi:hypothetical protein